MQLIHFRLPLLGKHFAQLGLLLLLLCSSAFSQTLNLGKVNFPNSGSPAAQETFLDGLAALHCFWYPKALEKFQEAQKIDPQFALAYWGEAMTFDHPAWFQEDLEGGRAALKKLTTQFPDPKTRGKTELEKEFIQSLFLLYGKGSKAERDLNYKKALEKIYAKHPEQIEVVTFYALSVLGTVNSYEGNFNKQLSAAKVMEKYLEKGNPDALNHPGLLHYLIHAYDHPQYAHLGLKYADLYAEVSPDSFHALHMPSHIFVPLGIWDRVAKQNIDAYQASLKWAKLDKKGNEAHDFHSLYWQLYAYLQMGRYKDALGIVNMMSTIAKTDSADRVQGYAGVMRARFALETNQWVEFPFPKNPEQIQKHVEANIHAGCMGTETEHNRISTLLALGIGGIRTGQVAVSEAALASAEGVKNTYPHENGDFNQKIVDIEKLLINGFIQIHKGQKEIGMEMLKAAASKEQTLDLPWGLPIPPKPATEFYAEALLGEGNNQQALDWFKKSLIRTPNRSLSLLGAYRAAKGLGKAADAQKYKAALEKNWSSADPDVKKMVD